MAWCPPPPNSSAPPGERKGVMVRPGMTDNSDRQVARLEGPLRWAVDLSDSVQLDRASVAIGGPLPLPV